MSEFKLTTPVAFFIFNRPDTTARVFDAISKVKPSKLLLIADGPRQNKSGEYQKVVATRSIVSNIDWPCDVITNYSDINLGCKMRISSGLDWVFENVEKAIILEDDCLPEESFFRFCQELLEKYQHDTRIAQISGTNFNANSCISEESYFFSKYNPIWGWATWRRSWLGYDVNIETWPKYKKLNKIININFNLKIRKYWINIFNRIYDKKIDTWDYQWTYKCIFNSELSIIPKKNLITNIGFGEDATHTKDENEFSLMKAEVIEFPLIHPETVLPDFYQDNFVDNIYLSSKKNYVKNFYKKFYHLLNKLLK